MIRTAPLTEAAMVEALEAQGFRVDGQGWVIACGSFPVEATAARILCTPGTRVGEYDGVPVHSIDAVIRDETLPENGWEIRQRYE